MNINLKELIKPGDSFHGITSVQTDYHVWQNLQADWTVTEVYPYWLKAVANKKKIFSRKGTSADPYVLKPGKEVTFNIGDLVMSGVVRQ